MTAVATPPPAPAAARAKRAAPARPATPALPDLLPPQVVPPEMAELLRDGDLRVQPIDVARYHAMIESGVLPTTTHVELIHGLLVEKNRRCRGDAAAGAPHTSNGQHRPMSIGIRHTDGVEGVEDVRGEIDLDAYTIRVQQPLVLPLDGEPEPDGMILRGPKRAWRGRKPLPGDVLCVFEVADESLRHDRTTKLALYAQAGVPMYVIVNLVDNVLEVHAGPDAAASTYTRRDRLAAGDRLIIPLDAGQTLDLAAGDLIPD